MKLRHVLFAVALVSVITLAYFQFGLKDENTSVSQLTEVSLRLPIPVADTAFAPYCLGVDKGIFERHGLKVKIEPGTPDLNPVKMVAQQSDQFGVIGGPELLLSARAKNAPLVGIALIHKDSDFVTVISLKDSGITRVQQLEGKKVGFFYGHISTDILHMLFAKEHVKVQEVDVGFDYGPFLGGQLDGQWAFRTTAGISLPAKGIQLNVISPADYGIVTQGHMVITSEGMIRDRPDVVQRFTKALVESLAYSVDHPQEAIAATTARDPKFLPEVGGKQLAVYNPAIMRNRPLGWIDMGDMERTKNQMVSVGLLPADFDVAASFTTRFLK